MRDVVRIGAGSGMLYDSALGVEGMLTCKTPPDYIIFDHMSEATMQPFLTMRQASEDQGYSNNFVDIHVGPYLDQLMAKGIKLITNAGGLNPQAAVRALQKRAAELGISPKIAVVEGDDLRHHVEDLKNTGYRDMFTNEAWPKNVVTANAYFGAFPIAQALKMGADIVLTGRCADSALALGPLIHEFGWTPDDYDRLAAGTCAGHLIECGAQATGGVFTDWMELDGVDNIGFPIAEFKADGTFVVTKPEGTGGRVSLGTLGEQLLYEVSDPKSYYVADVACDFSGIKMREVGPDRIEVSNVRGRAPNGCYKVTAVVEDGWRAVAFMPVFGTNAEGKSKRITETMLARTKRLMDKAGLGPFTKVHIDMLGTGKTFAVGPTPNTQQTETVNRVVVIYEDIRAARYFVNEAMAMPTNSVQGMVSMGLPQIQPVHRLFSFLIPRDKMTAKVTMDDGKTATLPPENPKPKPGPQVPENKAIAETGGGDASLPLIALAYARAGDKGNLYNVAVIARKPEYLPHIRSALTEQSVAKFMLHTFDNPDRPDVKRYDAPGVHALNFVFNEALAGGGSTFIKFDAFGKSMAQTLLQMPIAVPKALASKWDGNKLSA